MNKFTAFQSLLGSGGTFDKVLTYLLDEAGYSKSRIARIAGVSLSSVTKTFSGSRHTQSVMDTVSHVLQFNPFEYQSQSNKNED